MTVSTSGTPARAAGNGVSTVYVFTFKIFSDTDLVVRDILDSTGVPTTKALTTDYSVTISATGEGGSITFVVAPAAGHTIDIRTVIPLTQPTDIRNQGRFLPEIHENEFDRLERQIQDTRRIAESAIRFPDYEVARDMSLPAFASIAGKYVALDANAKPIGASGTGNDSALRTDLASAAAGADGARLLGFSRTDTGAVATSVYAILNGLYLTSMFGLVGDGATSDTAKMQAAVNAVPDGGTLVIDRGTTGRNFSIGTVTVTGKSITVDARGAKFTLSGDNAGFQFHGTIRVLRWCGGFFTGDGANRDADTSKIQVAVLVGNNAGDDIADVIVDGVICTAANVGVKIAYGTAPNNTVDRALVLNPTIFNSAGFAGGSGYGVQFAQVPGGQVIGGYISGCQRHGLYFSEGENYRADSVQITACGKNDGTIRGAISCSRSAKCTFSNMLVHDNNDVGMAIDTDSQGIAPKTNSEVVVTGGTWSTNKYGDIIVGTSANPAVDGTPHNTKLNGVVFKAPAVPGASILTINQADGLDVRGCVFDASLVAAGTLRLVSIDATGGVIYCDKIRVKGNTFRGGGGATTIGFQVAALLCTGTQQLDLRGNDFDSLTNEFEFLSGEDSITNTNLYYDRKVGYPEPPVAVTYSAAMTVQSRKGGPLGTFIIVANNGVAFTINAPTVPYNGQIITFKIRNASGGALGAATWNAVFKMLAWTQPANGFSRNVTFQYNGTNWEQIAQTSDIPT